MTLFSRRAITGQEPLGEKLRKLREESGPSPEQFATQAGIQQKYVVALEAGHYGQLPGEVYIRNFLRKYAEAFHVSPARLLELYEQERVLVRHIGPIHRLPQAAPETQAPDIYQILKILGSLGILCALLAYLGITVYRVITPPALSVFAPAEDMITHELSLVVSGTAEKESLVRINGQEVVLDPNGGFVERIDLQQGLNVIKVSAKKPHSREQMLYRKVIVKAAENGQP